MKTKTRKLAPLLICAVCLHAWADQDQDIRAAVKAAASVPPGDFARYVELRAAAIEISVESPKTLRDMARAENWTADSWRPAVVAASCLLRQDESELVGRVERPRGLEPAIYGRFRKPKPWCEPELVRCGREALPLLLEAFLWGADGYPYSEGEAGELEALMYKRALLAAAGNTEDKRMAEPAADLLKDSALASIYRREAALALGKTGGDSHIDTLSAIAFDGELPQELREACARGIGFCRTEKAAGLLSSLLATDLGDSPAVTSGALYALGSLGDAWVWNARVRFKPDSEATSHAVRSAAAKLLLEALKKDPQQTRLIGESLARVAWPESVEALTELAESGDVGQKKAAGSILPAVRMAVERAR